MATLADCLPGLKGKLDEDILADLQKVNDEAIERGLSPEEAAWEAAEKIFDDFQQQRGDILTQIAQADTNVEGYIAERIIEEGDRVTTQAMEEEQARLDDEARLAEAEKEAERAAEAERKEASAGAVEDAQELADAQPMMDRFREIINSDLPRSQWAEELGATPDQMIELIASAVETGLLRMRPDGTASRVAPGEGELTNEVYVLEEDAAASRNILDLGTHEERMYARNLFFAGANTLEFNAVLGRMRADENLSTKQVRAIAQAYINGTRKTPTRDKALKAMREVHRERVDAISRASVNGRSQELVGLNLDLQAETAARIMAMLDKLNLVVDMKQRTHIESILLSVSNEMVDVTDSKNEDGKYVDPDHGEVIPRELLETRNGRVYYKPVEANRGEYDWARHLLAVSLGYGPSDAIATLTHESIHILRRMGVINDKMWKHLVAATKRKPKKSEAVRIINRLASAESFYNLGKSGPLDPEMAAEAEGGFFARITPERAADLLSKAGEISYREIYDIDNRYANQSIPDGLSREEMLEEEAVAHLLEDWKDGLNYGTRFDRAARAIEEFLNALREFMFTGNFTTPGMIFDTIYSGRLGQNTEMEQTISLAKQQRDRLEAQTQELDTKVASRGSRRIVGDESIRSLRSLREQEALREMPAKKPSSGVFRPSRPLYWAQLPDAEFIADIAHIARKRSLGWDRSGTPQPKGVKSVGELIQDVLDNASFAYLYEPATGKMSYNIVKTGSHYDSIVAMKLDPVDGRLKIVTAFNQAHERTSDRMMRAAEVDPHNAVQWKTAQYDQREVLRRIAQVPDDRRGRSWHLLRRSVIISQGQISSGGVMASQGARLRNLRDFKGPVHRSHISDATDFYSRVEHAAFGLKQDRGSADQMRQMIRNQPGITDLEMDTLGLDLLFDMKRELAKTVGKKAGVVTRDEILDTIDRNRARFEETLRLADPSDITDLSELRDQYAEGEEQYFEVRLEGVTDEEGEEAYVVYFDGEPISDLSFETEDTAQGFIINEARERSWSLSDEELLHTMGYGHSLGAHEALQDLGERSGGYDQYTDFSFGYSVGVVNPNYRSHTLWISSADRNERLSAAILRTGEEMEDARRSGNPDRIAIAEAEQKRAFADEAKRMMIDKTGLNTYSGGHFSENNVVGHYMGSHGFVGPQAVVPQAWIRSIEEKISAALEVNPKTLASGAGEAALRKGAITPVEAWWFSAYKKFPGIRNPHSTEMAVWESIAKEHGIAWSAQSMPPVDSNTGDIEVFLTDQIQSDWGQAFRDHARSYAIRELFPAGEGQTNPSWKQLSDDEKAQVTEKMKALKAAGMVDFKPSDDAIRAIEQRWKATEKEIEAYQEKYGLALWNEAVTAHSYWPSIDRAQQEIDFYKEKVAEAVEDQMVRPTQAAVAIESAEASSEVVRPLDVWEPNESTKMLKRIRETERAIYAMKQVPKEETRVTERLRLTVQEYEAAKAPGAPYNPMIGDTDTWVKIVLKRIIQQAIEEGQSIIVTPKGETVLEYNPGDDGGMSYFYNVIVKNRMQEVLRSYDKKSPKPVEMETMKSTPASKSAGKGFYVWSLTEKARAEARDKGSTYFSKGRRLRPDSGLRPNGDHVDRISTRFPTQVQSEENPILERLVIGEEHMVHGKEGRDGDIYQFNADLIRSYGTWRAPKKTDADTTFKAFKQHLVENLLWLHDQVPEETRRDSRRWYDGARVIVDHWHDDFKHPPRALAGVLAALSPQKDWPTNVGMAERVLDIMRDRQSHMWDGSMMEMAKNKVFWDSDNKRPKKDAKQSIADLKGKTLAQLIDEYGSVPLPASDSKADLQAYSAEVKYRLFTIAKWIRVYDEAHNTKFSREPTMDGNWIGDPDLIVRWGSFNEIGKAVSVLLDSDYGNISAAMGGNHKVRNFYNNILAPNAPWGDVTVDTHAVGAANLLPIGAAHFMASHGMGLGIKNDFYANKGIVAAKHVNKFGVKGVYGIYADAYREAAALRGILPREMQSITWEAARGLFVDTWKTESNYRKSEDIWRRYADGKITAKEARTRIGALAGGIEQPGWVERRSGDDVAIWDSSYEGELSGGRLARRARRDRARDRGGNTGASKGRGRATQKSLGARLKGPPPQSMIFDATTAALEAAKSFKGELVPKSRLSKMLEDVPLLKDWAKAYEGDIPRSDLEAKLRAERIREAEKIYIVDPIRENDASQDEAFPVEARMAIDFIIGSRSSDTAATPTHADIMAEYEFENPSDYVAVARDMGYGGPMPSYEDIAAYKTRPVNRTHEFDRQNLTYQESVLHVPVHTTLEQREEASMRLFGKPYDELDSHDKAAALNDIALGYRDRHFHTDATSPALAKMILVDRDGARTFLGLEVNSGLEQTDNAWVDLALHHMLQRAVDLGSDEIALPIGTTVKAISSVRQPAEFYTKVMARKMSSILREIDPAAAVPQKVKTMPTSEGGKGMGYRVWQITDAVRARIERQQSGIDAQRSVVTPGLSMDVQARMERARDQGWDMDESWYHGTTHVIEGFDPERMSLEGYLGQSVYVTDNSRDASVNYASINSPDFAIRHERLAEFMQSNPDSYAVDEAEIERLEADFDYAKEKALDELKGAHDGAVIPLVARLNSMNILDLRNDSIDFTFEEDVDGEAINEESSTLGKIKEALDYMVDVEDINSDTVISDLLDAGHGYGPSMAGSVDQVLRSSEGIMHAWVEGHHDMTYAQGEVIRRIWQALGYDGVIIDASEAFSNMDIDPSTRHLMVFNPSNLRSPHARFDPAEDKSANIMASKGSQLSLGLAQLSLEQRKARAEELGFDTSRTLTLHDAPVLVDALGNRYASHYRNYALNKKRFLVGDWHKERGLTQDPNKVDVWVRTAGSKGFASRTQWEAELAKHTGGLGSSGMPMRKMHALSAKVDAELRRQGFIGIEETWSRKVKNDAGETETIVETAFVSLFEGADARSIKDNFNPDSVMRSVGSRMASVSGITLERMNRAIEIGLPTEAYHGTMAESIFGQFRIGDDNYMLDQALGVHAAKDPAIANTFTRRMPWEEEPDGARVYKIMIPDESKMLVASQRANQYDQSAIQNMILGVAFRADPSLAIDWMERLWNLSREEATEYVTTMLDGKEVEWLGGKYDLPSFIENFSPKPVTEEGRQRAIDLARKAWMDQGYEGIKYVNTSPMENAGGPADSTSYIVFDPTRIRAIAAEFDPSARGDSMMASRGSKVSAPQLNQILARLKHSLGVNTHQVKYGVNAKVGDKSIKLRTPASKRVGAMYRKDTGSAYVKATRDMKAVANVGGHALERTIGRPLQRLQEVHRRELVPPGMIAPPGQAPLSDGFSRFFEAYVTDKARARRDWKEFYAAFEDMLDATVPHILNDLDKVHSEYEAWTQRATVSEMSSDLVSMHRKNDWKTISDGEKSFSEVRNGWFATAYTATIDDANPVQMVVRKLLNIADENGVTDENGLPISLKATENAYKQLRMFRGSYSTGYTYITEGIPHYRGDQVVFPGLKLALDRLFGGKAYDEQAYHDFGQYLVSLRAIEEYNRLAQKEQRLEDIDADLKRHASVASQLRAQQSKDLGAMRSKIRQGDRQVGRLNARQRDLDRAKRDLQNLIERHDDLRSQLYDDNLDDAPAGAMERVRRRVSEINRQQIAAKRRKDALQDEVTQIEMDLSIREADVKNLKEITDNRAKRLEFVNEAVDSIKKLRKRVERAGASRPPTQQSQEWHEHYVASIQADRRFVDLDGAAKVVYQYTFGLLNLRHEAGLIDTELFEELASRRDFYVPFQRDMSDVPGGSLFQTAGAGRTFSPYKKFDGSDRAIINPMQVLSQDAYRVAQHIAINEAAQSLVNMADRAGEGSAQILEVLDQRSTEPEAFDKLIELAIQFGYDPADAIMIAAQMDVDWTNAELETLWSPVSKGPKPNPTIPFWKDGKRTFIQFNDPEFGQDAVNAIKGMGQEQINQLLDLPLGVPSRILQIGVTTSPNFMPRNLVRDMIDAWIKIGALPILTQIEGAQIMRNTGKEGADFQRRYLEAGGITGGRNVAAMTQQEKQRNLLELDPTRWTWTGVGIGGIAGAALGSLAAGPIGGVIGAALGGYGARSGQVVQLVEAVENMTRYGAAAHAYREAKRNNPQLTEQEAMAEAAYVARDIFDWNRRGSKTLAFLRMVTFLNAQVQGLDRAARGIAATGDRGSAVQKQMRIVWRNEQGLALSADEKRDLAQAYKLYWRLGLYTLGLVGLYALFANDPEYEDILDKSKFTHTWLPNTLGVDIRIPSAFEWAWPAVVAQIIADDISEKDPNGLSRFAHSVQELFVPPAVPQAATLYMGWMTGVDRDAFGEEARDIIGMGQTGLEPERQFNAYTGMMARDITAAMAAIGLPRSMIPSAQVVHWSLMTGGYWSRDINTAYDKIREAATGKIGRDTRPQEAIILSGFLGNAARTSKSIKNFWQMASRSGGEYRVVSNQYKSFKKKGVQNQGIEYLHRQDEEHRDYALLEGEFKIDQKVMHPLNRMMRMNRVLTHLTHDVIENKISLGKRLRRKPEQLDPSNLIAADSKTKAALMTIIEKLRRAEAWNTMVVMNRDGWIGKKEFDADAIMRLMEAQAPEVHAALMVRMGEARVHDMETIKTAWPALRDQIRAQYPDAY